METERFIEIVENAGLDVTDYSGRAMFGKYCVGIVGANEAEIVATVLGHFGENAMADAYNFGVQYAASLSDTKVKTSAAATKFGEAQKEIAALAEIFRGAKRDNMGRDVVLYFPTLAWPENRNASHCECGDPDCEGCDDAPVSR